MAEMQVPTMGAKDSPDAVYDARVLGKPRMVLFGLQHMFAMFGANRVMRYFPPVVTGPIVICIGLILASSAIANCSTNWLVAVITIMPIALATMIEHIGDISAISSTCNRNYIAEPGLHRTLLGAGLATILASLFGAPAHTTYGENTSVLALTKVFDPRVVRIAAIFAIVFSFCPKFAAVIGAMPASVIGGVSLILYGMISAVGVRNLIENSVDFTVSRNIIIAAIILVLAIGIAYSSVGVIVIPVGDITISLSGLAVGSLAGIILNIILPGKDAIVDIATPAPSENMPLSGPGPYDPKDDPAAQ